MKSPLYVKTVAQCYKEAIDSHFEGNYSEKKIKIWKERLSNVFNRGFHTGFYFEIPNIEDIQFSKRGNISRHSTCKSSVTEARAV